MYVLSLSSFGHNLLKIVDKSKELQGKMSNVQCLIGGVHNGFLSMAGNSKNIVQQEEILLSR